MSRHLREIGAPSKLANGQVVALGTLMIGSGDEQNSLRLCEIGGPSKLVEGQMIALGTLMIGSREEQVSR